MCRGFHPNGGDCINLRAFYIHISLLSPLRKSLPEILTLNYPPRIDESPLEISGSGVRSNAPGFVSLHRVVSAGTAVYGSRERVKAGEGARFELYAGDCKLMKGIFRKDWGDDSWKLECKFVGSEEENSCLGIKGAEVRVWLEGDPAEPITERVEMAHTRRRKGCERLEEIPEGRETETEAEGCCRCCCGEGEAAVGGREDCRVPAVEGVGWAVDAGIWILCFGVGYLRKREGHVNNLILPYKPESEDVIALSNVRPERIEDLNRPKMSYLIAVVKPKEEEDESDWFTILAAKPLDSLQTFEEDRRRGNKLFIVYLTNLTTHTRIWSSLNVNPKNASLKIVKTSRFRKGDQICTAQEFPPPPSSSQLGLELQRGSPPPPPVHAAVEKPSSVALRSSTRLAATAKFFIAFCLGPGGLIHLSLQPLSD
ncbi:hypothetical protein DM860_002194 [Cuscuta australis]|uniref:DUF6469 domain-containing protein n=1 Tax=Cuscuta australis TaxID=267555 RepID=A0A328E0H1_9ASTE|nr:hypothetical protein DM860_002194 [Cuscuta australis]